MIQQIPLQFMPDRWDHIPAFLGQPQLGDNSVKSEPWLRYSTIGSFELLLFLICELQDPRLNVLFPRSLHKLTAHVCLSLYSQQVLPTLVQLELDLLSDSVFLCSGSRSYSNNVTALSSLFWSFCEFLVLLI